MQYNEVEKGIIKLLQGDIPLKPRPYEDLAKLYAVSEDEIVDTIKQMHERKQIRRLGAVLYHRQVGYIYNAMVVWQVPEPDIDQAGETMAAFPEVSHCYWRETPEDFPYNLFTMIHSRSQENMEIIIQEIINQTGIKSHLTIKSIKELKKVSMKYI